MLVLGPFSLFLSPGPFFGVDFLLKQALSHVAIWTPATPGFNLSSLVALVERELLAGNSFSR